MRYLVMAGMVLAPVLGAVGEDRIVVDPGQELGRVDERIYGHFLEHIYHSVVDGLWGQVVRGASFEEPGMDIGEEWEVRNGVWQQLGGELAGPQFGSDCHVLTGDPAWQDYVFEAEARKDCGREGFLVLFRAVDNDNFYWWNLGGWGNTFSAVEREEDGARRQVVGTRTDTVIEEGRWYKIRIEVAGPEVVCFLDGERMCGFEDGDLGHGRVGLGGWSTGVRYRNVRVTHGNAVLFEMEERKPGDSVSSEWTKYPDEDAPITLQWMDENPLNSAYCQRMKSKGGQGGICQAGLSLEKGADYRGSVWLRGEGPVVAMLDDGEAQHEEVIKVDSRGWVEHGLSFTPKQTTADGRLSIALTGAGDVFVDQCTLSRADTPYREAIFEKVKAIRPAFIRWPGGCYAEHYRWKDAIGPMKDRVTKPNFIWGGMDPNYFGTAEFIQLCRDVNAEPVIVLNIGHHEPAEELDAYIEEALDWVEYCNGGADTPFGALRAEHGYPEPFDVVYWEIGNETWVMGVERYAERVKRFVDALREKHEGLEYLVCGSGGHNLDWNRRIVELAGSHMDYLSVHHYMEGPFQEEMRNGVAYPEFLHKTAEVIAASANPGIKIAVTEWNQQSVALRTGLYAGLVLNGFERYGDEIAMTCPALFIRRTDATAWDNAFINHDSHRVFAAPNYLVMKLYREHYAPIRVAVDGPEGLNVMATRDPESGDVILKAVNPSEEEDVVATVEVKGQEGVSLRQWRVWSPGIDDKNSLGAPENIRVVESVAENPVTFPAHSVTVLRTGG